MTKKLAIVKNTHKTTSRPTDSSSPVRTDECAYDWSDCDTLFLQTSVLFLALHAVITAQMLMVLEGSGGDGAVKQAGGQVDMGKRLHDTLECRHVHEMCSCRR